MKFVKKNDKITKKTYWVCLKGDSYIKDSSDPV